MSKRRNENGQMRREEWEAEDDCEGDAPTGEFQRASADAISRRKILKAKPLGAKKSSNGAAPPLVAAPVTVVAPPAPTKSNPFQGFQGLTAAKSSEPPVRLNPFAGFSGLTGSAPTPTPAAAPAAVATSATSAPPANYQEAIEALNKEFQEFVKEQLDKYPSSDWTAAMHDYLNHAQEIGTKFSATKPVAASVPRPIVSAPAVSAAPVKSDSKPLTAPALAPAPASSSFSFGTKKDSASATSAAAPSSTGFSFGATASSTASTVSSGFTFGAKETAKETDAPKAEAPKASASGFSFGAKFAQPKTDSDSTPTIPAFSFGTKPAEPKEDKATPAFKFGSASPSKTQPPASSGFSFSLSKPSAPAAPSSGFSFSLSSTSSAPASSSGFAFGSAASSNTAPAASAAAEDEDEENIGREEATVILKSDNPDEDCKFDVEKAKILEFKKDEKRWADKGTHPLKVLVNKETKNARILVRNEIGKIVLNSALYKGLAIKPHEANGKKQGALLALQIDGSITQFILKVNAEKVDAFLSALKDATPK